MLCDLELQNSDLVFLLLPLTVHGFQSIVFLFELGLEVINFCGQMLLRLFGFVSEVLD
jgi:hypothetical protein